MGWTKDTTSQAPKVVYTPPAELNGLVERVVRDPEAGTWEIVYTDAGIGRTQAEIEAEWGL